MTGARPRLGFVGIGLMGEGMTRRLLDRGWTVTVWNQEPERLDMVIPHGAVAAASPAAVADASDFVLMCVLHTEAVRRCVFAPDGIAAAQNKPRIVIDLSTADPEATREMAMRLRTETGTSWVDAPISGGPGAARQGTMTIMAGGEPSDIEAIQPIMDDLAANFTPMGPVGAGQTTKIINQAIVGTGYVLMAEAVVLAEAAGIAAERLPQCLAGGAADSVLLQTIYRQMKARDFAPPKGYARQLLKDLKAVVDFERTAGLSLPIVETACDRYAAYVGKGNEMEDSASIVRLYEGTGS
ncbi:NAD(P)-dependent oxidoreductase [Microvirga lotononidis]|uniref:Beta-hydroxyacid dehydrogenase, 3-hydroxyisobutyrate dehydrogenase n=1 Tax=Microvirga lotononidis TaxID=864069 RepID=I4YSJ1_9HYPH|nr:NAD(P)-dependent oxidoreductase [Microvirga lotononidis]EIM26933.1 beta-hydroxyacid dehydrogenase, 3-hydroxyisobutyrate dehydrogenase [Microvirga lotononidis]WQO31477.1 NAD(P)-dependent oxidoreductase [Microvirga lotononidis]